MQRIGPWPEGNAESPAVDTWGTVHSGSGPGAGTSYRTCPGGTWAGLAASGGKRLGRYWGSLYNRGSV
jgi:hypothetical protein